MDCSFGQVYMGESHACWQPAPKFMTPVEVGWIQVTGLIDLGSGQTLVRQKLTPDPEQVLGKIRLQCTQWYVRLYPSAWDP